MSRYLIFILLAAVLNGCGVYSFTGDSIDYTQVSTISISTFYNDTGHGPPDISQTFTEALRDYFVRNSKLTLTESNGDLQVEGSIVNYFTAPVAPVATGNDQAPDQAGATRLRIDVRVTFINTIQPEQDFTRNFSFFADFDALNSNLTAEEDQLIETIFDQIIIDIFSATVANW